MWFCYAIWATIQHSDVYYNITVCTEHASVGFYHCVFLVAFTVDATTLWSAFIQLFVSEIEEPQKCE